MGFFSKVLDTVKDVAPVALSAGAVVFTAGAAFGGSTGGWGDIVSGITESVGLDGIVGDVITGAITQAGYGAALGGVASMVMGGDFMDGARMGALGGLVTGGVMGGIGGQDLADPLKGAFGGEESSTSEGIQASVSQAAAAVPVAASQGAAVDAPLSKASEALQVTSAADGTSSSLPTNHGSIFGGGSGASGGGGGGGSGAKTAFFGEGGWLERNGELVGQAAKGLGGGLLAMASATSPEDEAQARARANIEEMRAKQQMIADNYGGGGGMTGLLSRSGAGSGAQGPTPGEVYDRQIYGTTGPGRYVYDPRQRRVVFVPNQPAVA